MIQKQYSAALTATCMILGIIIGVQYNTVKHQSITTENQRLSEASLVLKQMQAERDALQKQNEALEKTLAEYQDGAFDAEIEQLMDFAGLTEISGEGIIVRVAVIEMRISSMRRICWRWSMSCMLLALRRFPSMGSAWCSKVRLPVPARL